MSKLWGGRFEKETDRDVEAFTASIGVDARLWDADVTASQAHARMLGQVGVISQAESLELVGGLEAVRADLAEGRSAFEPSAEDVHSEIERLLKAEIGAVAGKLHTARSRNDQVATATRLYLRGQVDGLAAEIRGIQRWLVDAGERHVDTLMPGFTHLQQAQPVSLGHHLMAYFWMLDRDAARITECRSRVNRLPLGAAALAGTPFPIDRQAVARELGFEGVCANSLDAVSDRDFVVELLSACALVMTHLSRLSEELILWSTPAFGFVELDDSVTTGSSIMPQKKNPDVAELIRGRVGRVTGALVGALTLLKALPLSYNRDLQEDKGFLFEGLDVTRASLRMTALMLRNARFDTERMAAAAGAGYSNATDLADYLARKGLPFRECHEVAGKAVRLCIERGIPLEKLPLADLRALSPLIAADVLPQLDPRAVLEARKSEGGAGPAAVRAQIAQAAAALEPTRQPLPASAGAQSPR